MHYRTVFFWAAATALLSVPAFAAEERSAGMENKNLQRLEKQLASQKSEREALSKQAEDARQTMSDTKQRLLTVGQSVQKNERELDKLNASIAELDARAKNLEDELGNERVLMAELVLPLQRLRRLPPQAALIRAHDPYKTAQTAMLLQRIVPALSSEADTLAARLQDLDATRIALQDKHKKAKSFQNKLASQEKELTSLMDERERLFQGLNSDLERKDSEIKKISRESHNLKDLIARLQEQSREERREPEPATRALGAVFGFGGKGVQPPVNGRILIGYGESDEFGARSDGVTIVSKPGGLVVAPIAGEVRFAGEFKNYGPMVIIEHKSHYHSLIAGLGTINASVGDTVAAGEPVGRLKKSDGGKDVRIYYELRRDGQPVNPGVKL